MGERDRLRGDEADRGANRPRHDHLDDTRPHIGAGVLPDHEGARTAAGNPARTIRSHLYSSADDIGFRQHEGAPEFPVSERGNRVRVKLP